VNLEIPLKSGDAIGFRLALGDDGRSVKVTSEIVKTRGNYRNIIYLEYHTEVEVLDILLKDVLFVKHEDDGDIPLTIIGINEQIPRRASNAPAHFIAMFYEKIRFESKGGKITEMEHKYDFIEAEKKARALGKEPTPEDINRIIDGTNWSGKKFGEFFMKALEIRRKYPKARFWFNLEVL
jgi:hypothetical protein